MNRVEQINGLKADIDAEHRRIAPLLLPLQQEHERLMLEKQETELKIRENEAKGDEIKSNIVKLRHELADLIRDDAVEVGGFNEAAVNREGG